MPDPQSGSRTDEATSTSWAVRECAPSAELLAQSGWPNERTGQAERKERCGGMPVSPAPPLNLHPALQP